jgi:putative ABC transport system permease protein
MGERLFSLLLRLYPEGFRDRYRDDLLAFFREDRHHAKYGRGLWRPVRFWRATLKDLIANAAEARMAERTGQAPFDRRIPMAAPHDAGFVTAGRWRADARDAWRSLRATPGATAVALAVLTLGIGASTAIFAVADTVAFRALPFGRPGELVQVAEVDLKDGDVMTVAPQNFLEWQTRQDVFEDLGASQFVSLILRDGPRAERMVAVSVTTNLFGLLQVAPQLGRLFTPDDAVEGRDRVVILSDGFWRRHFGRDPGVIGRSLSIGGTSREVVGVMPPGFVYPLGTRAISRAEFWTPRVTTARDRERDGGRTYNLSVVGRLRPGVTIDAAGRRMQQIRDALAVDYPRWFVDAGVTVRPLMAAVVGPQVRAWMLLLLGAVALVLVIACVNVANVLLARGTRRTRELAVRAALGASRAALVRGLMVESLMLAAAAAACGLILAQLGIAALRATLPDQLPRAASIALDLRVFLIAAGASLLTGLVFGLVPALRLSRPELTSAMRDQGRSSTAGVGQQRLRAALVVVEVALAVVLLVGAALFVGSFARLLDQRLGFDPAGVSAIYVTTAEPDRSAIETALSRVASMPGVEVAAAVGGGLPLTGSYRTDSVTVSGHAEPFRDRDEPSIREVSVSYLEAMRLTLLRGRWIADGDTAATTPVVVISERAAERYFSGRDPIGQTITFREGPGSVTRTVVGVVESTRFLGPESDPSLETLIPIAQAQPAQIRSVAIAARMAPGVPVSGQALRAEAWAAAPGAIVSDVESLEERFGTLVAQRKFNTALIAVFAAIALVMVAIGIFGVMACSVEQRTAEIGVRMALGAAPSGMQRMVLLRAAVLAGIGLAIGVAGALVLERTIRGFLFQPGAFDPASYVAGPALVVTIALVAAWLPARRAARVDPLVALRQS